jgi:hypothetical protein
MGHKTAYTLALMMQFAVSAAALSAQAIPSMLHAPEPVAPAPEAVASPPDKKPVPEDWTTISLAKSNLPLWSMGGVPLSKVELPGCTRELLRMQWRPRDPIDLYVIRPEGVEKPPVILYLFNYNSDIDIFRDENWCTHAKQSGVATVGFVSALSGQRFHLPRPMKEWFVSELQEALSTSTHDVQMILNYLDSRGDLDMKHVGMLGHASGGSIAILSAAADPRIVALDVVDPWGDWPDWLRGSKQIPEAERAAYLKPEFLHKVASLDPVDYLAQCKAKSIRIEQVLDDPATPSTTQDKIAGATLHAGAVVRFEDRAAQAKAWGESGVSGWIESQLKSGKQTEKEGQQ